jgi:hypothetical protein
LRSRTVVVFLGVVQLRKYPIAKKTKYYDV